MMATRSGHLACWMVNVHGGSTGHACTELPENKYYRENRGTWDSNPGPEANSNGLEPTGMLVLFVYMLRINYNIRKKC